MILPLTRPLIALDVETHDKVPPEQARIVELGFHIEYPDGHEPKRWVSLINPGVPIVKDATGVHGITDAMMHLCMTCGKSAPLELVGSLPMSNGEDFCRCEQFKRVPTFAQLAHSLVKGFSNCDFCGYHVDFDLRVLAAEFAREGIEWSRLGALKLDSMQLWRVGKPRTLTDAVREFLGREPTEAHRALGDAEDALEVAMAQLVRFELPRDLKKLHDLCFDSNNVDPDGKFIWKNGEVTFKFGKYVDKTLRSVVAKDSQYLSKFMMNGDFSSDVKRLLREALEGRYPVKE